MSLDPVKLLSYLFPTAPGVEPLLLEIDVDRRVLTAVPENPLQALRAVGAPTLTAIADALRTGAADPRVRGLIIHVGTCPLTLAQTDELGAAIAEFSKVKPSVAYTESFGELDSGMTGYRLAVHARQIWLQPTGAVVLGGAHLDITLLRGALEKLSVTPEFAQRKEYKTAADQFAAAEVTDANREMMQRIADSVVEQTVALVAERRGLDAAAVRRVIDQGPLTAGEALDARFVDHLGYRDEVFAALRNDWAKDTKLLFAHRYSPTVAAKVAARFDRSRPAVAVVPVVGSIVTGRGAPASPFGGPQAASELVTEHLRAAVADDNVKAIVLAVDSPGGSYIASDTIRHAVIQARKSGRPVVAAMAGVAASGGYFVAMGADEIVATPSTLTGSIGVLAGKMVTQGLLERLGVVRQDVQAGDNADFLAGNRGFSERQREILDAWLDEVYADFTAKAAHDRGMDIAELEPLARGRVWTGADAHARNLVDHLGGRELAVARACALAGLDRDRVHVKTNRSIPFLDRIRPAESSEAASGIQGSIGLDISGEALLRAAGDRLGITHSGVLSLPLPITLR